MKKISICLSAFLLILAFHPAKAQFGSLFGGGFSGIVYDPTNYAIAVKDLAEAKVQVEKLAEQVQWAAQTKNQLTDIWQMQEDIKDRLFDLNGMKDLQWNELQGLFEQAMLIGSDPEAYFRYQIPHVRRFYSLLHEGGEPQDARNLYEFFYEKSTAYDPASSLPELLSTQSAQAEKRYAAETFAQKQKMQLAIGYMREADQQAIKAEELRQQAATEGLMSMSEGERALVLHAANHTMLQSMKMRESANRLYAEAMQKGPVQKLIDWQHRTTLLRDSKARLLPMLLPGA